MSGVDTPIMIQVYTTPRPILYLKINNLSYLEVYKHTLNLHVPYMILYPWIDIFQVVVLGTVSN